ncbi:hypothetical protein C0389_10805 [bacterium]|nr:hypothetical protein [bacterium]
MNKHEQFILDIVNRGGPTIDVYDYVLESFNEIGKIIKEFNFSNEQLITYWRQFGEAFNSNTLQSHVIRKPYGYAGDYEIIDKIYTRWTASDEISKKWDLFYQSQKAPHAVRARKDYFKTLIKQKLSILPNNRNIEILDIGCGSSRDIYELLNEIGEKKITFYCIDMDENAIKFSKDLCKNYLSQINFIHKNVLRFNVNKKYDIIWSAGLFDYLDDRVFNFLLKKLLSLTKKDSEIIIGNFSPQNPTRYYMECGYWFLQYRDKVKLLTLSHQVSDSNFDCYIDSEEEGINLFLHVKKDS